MKSFTPLGYCGIDAAYAPTAANFPILLEHWNYTSIANSGKDLVGLNLGITWHMGGPAGIQFRVVNTTAFKPDQNAITLTSGAYPASSVLVAMALGNSGTGNPTLLTLGALTDTTPYADLSRGSFAGTDQTHYDTLGALDAGIKSAAALLIDPTPTNGTATLYDITAATATTVVPITTAGTPVGGPPGGVHGFNLANVGTTVALSSSTGTYYNDIFLFSFSTAPTDVSNALCWMAANPGKIYPAWKGRV